MHPLLDILAGTTTGGLIAGGYSYACNWPTSELLGKTFIAGADHTDGTHLVALTYDDGPSPRNTPALLDVLAQHKAIATFFLIGEHVRKHPELARRVAAAGHVLGNHSATHPKLTRRNEAQTRDELTRCQKTIEDTTGISPTLFRPPYGARKASTLRIAREMGLTPVMWNITAQDWEPIGAAAILQRVESGMALNRRKRRGSNILLHDASHLDGSEFASREDTIAVTQTLVQREELRFTTPLAWLHS